MVVKPMDEVLGSCHHEAELAALRAALAAFTPHGMRDVRALWANGEVCRECSHALCERFREAQESALGNLAKYLRFAKALADAHAALAVAEEMAKYDGHFRYCLRGTSHCKCGWSDLVTRFHAAREKVGK